MHAGIRTRGSISCLSRCPFEPFEPGAVGHRSQSLFRLQSLEVLLEPDNNADGEPGGCRWRWKAQAQRL